MIRVYRDGSVTTIVICRQTVRNAVDGKTARALFDAFLAFENDDSAVVAILAGEGPDFCSGADLKAIASGQFNPTDIAGPAPMGPSRMLLKKPVIAAIEGHAVAGGLELALWCDLRVASESAVLGVYCRRWGVPLIDGGTVRLPRLVGFGRAMDLILTGRPVKAHEAHAMGLVNRVVPKGSALDHAKRLAEEIARFPQECMLTDRTSVYHQTQVPLDEALFFELTQGTQILGDHVRAGAQRFKDGSGRGGRFDN